MLQAITFSGTHNFWGQDRELKDNPAATANAFFKTWLLDRDVKGAMTYISPQSVLGTCMLPESLERKKTLTRRDISSVFRKVLDGVVSKIPRQKSLDQLIAAKGTDLFSAENIVLVEHQFESYFRLFSLNPAKERGDVAFVCKFDERKSFRNVADQGQACDIRDSLESERSGEQRRQRFEDGEFLRRPRQDV